MHRIFTQVYIPSVQTKRKLKDGTLSVKPKSLFPGSVFLRCILNREIHDFIREHEGVGGFVGSKVGNTKRQINKPRPVTEGDMKEIFKQAKEEQEKTDKAFEEEHQGEEAPEAVVSASPRKQGRHAIKASQPLGGSAMTGADNKLLVPGSTIQVVSGTFSGFLGILKKLDKNAGLATVEFTLFGKETIADVDVEEIVAEATLQLTTLILLLMALLLPHYFFSCNLLSHLLAATIATSHSRQLTGFYFPARFL